MPEQLGCTLHLGNDTFHFLTYFLLSWTLIFSLAHRFQQHLCHLGTRELARGYLTRAQQLPHFRAAQGHMLLVAMRAGLRGGHRVTGTAEKSPASEEASLQNSGWEAGSPTHKYFH